jgi:4-amino-4-deoxy-L-arabinose transferase-like glycosyltransferase
MKKKHYFLFLLCAAVMILFFNNIMPVTDNVESNYALTAKEMVLSGDWISPQIYGTYWYDKPVFFYWLTAIAFKIFGFTDFAARFFPSVFGIITLGFISWCGRKLFSEKAGFFAMLILSSFLMFFAISKLIITDAVLFLFFNATLMFFYLGYQGPSKNYYYLMYICAGLATLTKGPIGFLLPGLIIVLFLLATRNFKEILHAHLASGCCLFLLVTVPWYYAMYTLHGKAFLDVFLGVHNVLRATVSEHPKDNVIYYYTVLLLLMAFPWISFLPAALKDFFHAEKKFTLPSDTFLFLTINSAVVFFFFQNMATKYPTYTYPMLFPLALLLAGWWDKNSAIIKPVGPLIYNTIFNVLLLGALYIYKPANFQIQYVWFITLCLILAIVVPWVVRKNTDKLALALGITALLFNFSLAAGLMVPLTQVRSAKNLGAYIQKNLAQEMRIISYGDYPTSAVYYSNYRLLRAIPDSKEAEYADKDSVSWSSKNVMPYITYTQIKELNSRPVIVVNNGYQKDFREDFAQGDTWAREAELPGWEIWRRK